MTWRPKSDAEMSLGALSAPLLAARPLGCAAAPRSAAAAGHACLGGCCSCSGRSQLRSPSAFLLDARQRASAPRCRSSVLSGASTTPLTLLALQTATHSLSECGRPRNPTAALFLHPPCAHSPAVFLPTVSAQAAPAAASAPLKSVLNQRGAPLTPPSGGPAPPVWHAIIEVGGAQQIVQEGRFYSCHSLPDVQAGQKVVFERVLATKQPGGGALAIGKPYVAGAKVHATVLENLKDKKIIVFKMKAKKHYRRKAGHRQHMTRFLVTKVEFGA